MGGEVRVRDQVLAGNLTLPPRAPVGESEEERIERLAALGPGIVTLEPGVAVRRGLGRYLRQSNRSLFSVAAGLTQNLEIPVDGDRTTNVEAFAGAKYAFFTYDTPKTNLSATFVVYPSLSVGGRVRADTDITLSREIVSDFTVGLTLYDSFDNKPPGDSATKHDIGVTLSIGWVF